MKKRERFFYYNCNYDVNIKFKLNFYLMFIFIFTFLILINSSFVSAYDIYNYSANSTSYSIGSHTLGIEGANISGSSIVARQLSTAFQPGYNYTNSTSFSANVGFFSTTTASSSGVVSIDSYSIYPTSAAPGSIIRFGINASNVQAVWLKITQPNSTAVNITLVNNNYAYFTANDLGTYNLVFYANDSSGNLATALDSFVIANPQASQPSGGGVSGGGSCTYLWDCSPWSICSLDGQQTRICKNTGTCSGIENKPSETQQCSESLFDVRLKFASLNLTEEDKLKFDVTLVQTKNADKIDVQVKYTIFNANNTQIFSQIETKAVEKNLTYNKVLDELSFRPGKYNLRVDIIYADSQKATAEQGFLITSNYTLTLLPPWYESPIIAWIIAALLLVIIVLLIIMIILRNRKNKVIGIEEKKEITPEIVKEKEVVREEPKPAIKEKELPTIKLMPEKEIRKIRRTKRREHKRKKKEAKKAVKRERKQIKKQIKHIHKRIKKKNVHVSEIAQLRQQIKEWKSKGYDTSKLERKLDEMS